MPLNAGTRLGPYEVIAAIGAGGMGEVYRAHDTRLDREVAIKVLPADRLTDEHRRRRFVQEARSASALNHPHIVAIHEIESHGDIDFIVMEYVRGQSLDAIIPRHGLRLNEMLRIAIAIADALGAAHARGIVHRDLKPANVMIGDDGAVKVLDFGLAKLMRGDSIAGDETTTHAMEPGLSAPGAIVGTAAYMAPEQATGGQVDARSDIFSFGALLYKMATGARAFGGSSVADTLSEVIRSQPRPPAQIAPGVPRDLERLILRCLRKEPERRHQTILDVKIELQEIKEESDSGTAPAAAAPRRSRLWRVWFAAGIGALLLAAAAAWWDGSPGSRVPSPSVVPLTSLDGVEVHPSFSPDGEQIAFSWTGEGEPNEDIFVKFVDQTVVNRLTTDPAGDVFPRWSPDGKWIVFMRYPDGFNGPGYAYIVSAVAGGGERRVADFPVTPARWSPDGQWLVTTRYTGPIEERGVVLLSPGGATPRRLVAAQGDEFLSFPDITPDGRHLAYLTCDAVSSCKIYVVDLAADFRVAGSPRLLRQEPFFITESFWTRDGDALMYSTESVPFGFYLWRQKADGSRPPERIEIAGVGAIGGAAARTRDRLAFARVRSTVGVYVFGAQNQRPVLASAFWDHHPDFSPNGERLAFSSLRSGQSLEVWLAAADGSGARQLTHGQGTRQGSPAWSPLGDRLAYESNGGGRWSIWSVGIDGSVPRQLTRGPGQDRRPTWSHDGKWIYYASTGRGIWRVPSEGGEPQQVSKDGLYAVEIDNGRTLLYKPAGRESPLLSQPVAGGQPREVIPCVREMAFAVRPSGIYYAACGAGRSRPLRVFDPRTNQTRDLGTLTDVFRMLGGNRFAVSPDGRTILVHRESFSADLMMIENFR